MGKSDKKNKSKKQAKTCVGFLYGGTMKGGNAYVFQVDELKPEDFHEEHKKYFGNLVVCKYVQCEDAETVFENFKDKYEDHHVNDCLYSFSASGGSSVLKEISGANSCKKLAEKPPAKSGKFKKGGKKNTKKSTSDSDDDDDDNDNSDDESEDEKPKKKVSKGKKPTKKPTKKAAKDDSDDDNSDDDDDDKSDNESDKDSGSDSDDEVKVKSKKPTKKGKKSGSSKSK
jgi:hypothetical protein